MIIKHASIEEGKHLYDRGAEVLDFIRRGERVEARYAIEVLMSAIRLVYDHAPPTFQAEVIAYIKANLAELRRDA